MNHFFLSAMTSENCLKPKARRRSLTAIYRTWVRYIDELEIYAHEHKMEMVLRHTRWTIRVRRRSRTWWLWHVVSWMGWLLHVQTGIFKLLSKQKTANSSQTIVRLSRIYKIQNIHKMISFRQTYKRLPFGVLYLLLSITFFFPGKPNFMLHLHQIAGNKIIALKLYNILDDCKENIIL